MRRPPRNKQLRAPRSASRSETTSPLGGEVPDPHCPHCSARDAEVISLFGTQAMTLQYRCRRCGTVFEAIKYD